MAVWWRVDTDNNAQVYKKHGHSSGKITGTVERAPSPLFGEHVRRIAPGYPFATLWYMPGGVGQDHVHHPFV